MAARRRGGSEEALGPFFLFSEAELLHLVILNVLREKLKTLINRPSSVNPRTSGHEGRETPSRPPCPCSPSPSHPRTTRITLIHPIPFQLTPHSVAGSGDRARVRRLSSVVRPAQGGGRGPNAARPEGEHGACTSGCARGSF